MRRVLAVIVGAVVVVLVLGLLYQRRSASQLVVESHWSTKAAALDAGQARLGWIPEDLPEAAFDITERHDLDLNTGCGLFSLSEPLARAEFAPRQVQLPEDCARLEDARLERLHGELLWRKSCDHGFESELVVSADGRTGAWWTRARPCSE